MRIRIQNLIIGKKDAHRPAAELKKSLLSGYYSILGILVCFVYWVIDLFGGISETTVVYLVAIGLHFTSFLLNRKGKRELSNYILLPSSNLAVYLFASSESSQTATFIFFPVTCLGAFALFGHQERGKAIAFSILSLLLFYAAYFVDFSFLPQRIYDISIIRFTMLINFSAALVASLLLVYLLIDINHLQELEILEKNNLLIKTNAELDRFVYSTSHDLRAPLASILGLLNIARAEVDLKTAKHYMKLMEDRVRSLDVFIKDITDYSRNNRLEIRKDTINLKELADEVWENLRYAPEANTIDLQLDFPEHTIMENDRCRLKVILSNLISNAIRYHDLSKNNRFIRLAARANGHAFYLEVEDNGQGIDPQYKVKIFEMFFRAHEKSKGSGLGLYIVRETAAKLQGTVDVESQPGVGSVFTIRLPYLGLKQA